MGCPAKAKIALQPASTGPAVTHYENTIDRLVPLTEVGSFVSDRVHEQLQEEYGNGRAPIWGAVEGNRAKFNRMERGDLVLFYRDKGFISQSQVTFLLPDSDDLANHLWEPDPKSGSYRHVFFLDRIDELQIPWSPVREFLGWKPKAYLQSLHVLDEDESTEFLELLAGLDPSIRSPGGLSRDPIQDSGAEAAEMSLESGQGFQSSAAVRKALEDRSMELAEDYFRSHGFSVKDVSSNQPYDLGCKRESDGLEVHVEVKGTQTQGNQVILTAKKVEFAREHADHMVLCVVHSIEVRETSSGEVEATGGVRRMHIPWDIDAGELRPISFRYKLP